MIRSYHVYQILYVANHMSHIPAGRSWLVLHVWCDYNLCLSSHLSVCRCQKPPCRAVSGVGAARQCYPPMPWHCTSSRSPWLTGSPLRRSNSNSSSFQASETNSSSLTTCRQRETGRLFVAAALVVAHAVPPPATRMVRTPASWQSYHLLRTEL